MREDWIESVLDEHAKEGEHLDDDQLAFVRTEARLREVMDHHVFYTLDLLDGDPETREFLRDHLLDDDEVDEVLRRVTWHNDQQSQKGRRNDG